MADTTTSRAPADLSADPIDGPVLVTGAAGFIGAALCEALLDRGCEVTGFDNLNPYYDPALKRHRLDRLEGRSGFAFRLGDLADREALGAAFDAAFPDPARPAYVVNLAAQAGVRYSIDNPHAYGEANLTGFLNVSNPYQWLNFYGVPLPVLPLMISDAPHKLTRKQLFPAEASSE